MVGSAAPASRARRRLREPLYHVLSLTSERRAVRIPNVAFLAVRRYSLLPSARPPRRGEGGGCRAGGRTAPGDGAGRDAAARRGWRRGRSRRLRQSERDGGCGEPTGPGCAVFVRQSGAPGGDCLHRCFCIICYFYTFLWTILLRWHAPRLFAALASSLMLDLVAFCKSCNGPRGSKNGRRTATPPRGAIRRRGDDGRDCVHGSRRRPSQVMLPPVGSPFFVDVGVIDERARGAPARRPAA